MRKITYQIPVHKENKSIPHYAEREGYSGRNYDWVAPERFKATIIFQGFSRGRSAAYAQFSNKTTPDQTFCVFLSDLENMILDPKWRRGEITGIFQPCKRGCNFGIKLV